MAHYSLDDLDSGINYSGSKNESEVHTLTEGGLGLFQDLIIFFTYIKREKLTYWKLYQNLSGVTPSVRNSSVHHEWMSVFQVCCICY